MKCYKIPSQYFSKLSRSKISCKMVGEKAEKPDSKGKKHKAKKADVGEKI